ncbi:hypothetical protein J3A83DRAFT_4432363 [Scleroderma citrinum]
MKIRRTATFAWSPTSSLPVIATGTVSGALDESFSNESQLEIWEPTFTSQHEYYGTDDSPPKGVVKDTSRFNRIAWGQVQKDRTSGVIAAGMENGELVLWDPAKIVEHSDASQALILRNTIHTGPVRGLDFNPLQTNLLSSGAINGEVYIWDLNNSSKPYSPTPGSRNTKVDEMTCVSWNQQVQYVLAGASTTGYTIVWDLRGKREVVALSYGGGAGTLGGAVGSAMAVGGKRGMSAIAWHPDNATRLVTASEDDASPIIMAWDLRNARAPEKILTGHEKGVLSLSWCKQDADLLLSCGKDNRALCWNPQTSEVIGELPYEKNWAFQVEWCPRNPDLLAAAFFSGTIGIHSIQSIDATAASVPPTPKVSGAALFDDPSLIRSDSGSPGLSLKQPPKWLRRPVSASFGFGGHLVSVNNLPNAQGRTQSSVVHLRVVCTEPGVRNRVSNLRQAVQDNSLESFAQRTAEGQLDSQQQGDVHATDTWKALASLFRANSRDELVTLLGYSKEEVKAHVGEVITRLKETQLQQRQQEQQQQEEQPTDESSEQRMHEPVVSFAEPEHELDGEQETEEKTSSEVSTSDVLPPDGESTTTAPSLFGDDPIGFHADTGADFFSTITTSRQDDLQGDPLTIPRTSYAVDSSVAATIGSGPSSVASASDALSSRGNTFRIYPAEESETDQLVTKALVLGDFESAVDLCLSTERFADALLLAIKGGEDLLQRTQKAYFNRRTAEHPYIRLFESIVTNDLADIVQNADLTEWAEIFVVLCTFASSDEFAGLAEQLGSRLEFQAGVLRAQAEEDGATMNTDHVLELRKTATLTFLAAGRLERLVNIWIDEMVEEEMCRTHEQDPLGNSKYTARAHALQTFIEKVTIFRGAVKYTDLDLTTSAPDEDASKTYKLASLYDRYFEYAEMLAAQGLVKEAVEYLKLIPQGYTGSAFDSTAVRQRLLIASGEPLTRAPVTTGHISQKASVSASYAQVTSVARTQTPIQGGQYLPPQSPYQPAPLAHQPEQFKGPYIPAQPVVRPALLSQPVMPPPTRSVATTLPPRAQNGGWNDAPVVKADRRTPNASSMSKPAAIVSPFPNATQSPPTPSSPFSGPAQNAPLPPPPRPASVQSRPPPPPQARVPPPPQARPGPPPTRVMSPPQQPSVGTSPYTSPRTAPVLLGQPSGPYARATPPPGPLRGGVPLPSGPYVRATPPPGHTVPPPAVPQPGPYAPPPPSVGPSGPPQPGPYAPPKPSPVQYAPPPAQGQPGSGPGSYVPPMPAQAMRGPPPTQQQLGGMPPHPSQGPPGGAPSVASPPARAAPPRGPPPPKYPRGDRSHIPESALPIYNILSEHLLRMKQTTPPQQKRMVDDLERRINALFDSLNCETLSKPVVDQLLELTRAMEAHDREAALSIHVDLLTRGSQTDDIGLWMSGIKQLIMRL